MINNVWSIANMTTTSTACNDRQCLGVANLTTISSVAMATSVWCSQSDNNQHSVQWSPVFGLANLTTISTSWNDHPMLVIANLTTISANHAMITSVWPSQSDNYQRRLQWSPMFGLANLTTISAACNDHPCLVYSQSDNYQRSVQWSPMFGLANMTTISAACNDRPCLV